jgi:hypothetical protein
MFARSIWYIGLALELAIIGRSLWTRLYLRFPIFYVYMTFVFASSAWLILDYSHYSVYQKHYWYWEAVTILLGYGVLAEIMHRALEDFPGADRAAQFLASAIFAIIFAGLALSLSLDKNPLAIAQWRQHAGDALERDFRIVQAISLAITLAVSLYYRIEFGRNLRGLILGFGTYIGVSILSPAFRYYLGPRFDPIFQELQPMAYLFALGVWIVALWQHANARSRPPNPEVVHDYQKMVTQTRQKLRAVRSWFLPVEGRW